MKKMNRRDLIRTGAAGLASTSLMGAFVNRALAQQTNFKRCIIWYRPEGVAQKAFWPRNVGSLDIDMNASINGLSLSRPTNWDIDSYNERDAATYVLQPLKDHEDDINLYSGLRNRGAGHNDVHRDCVSAALTGGNEDGGSFDQIIGPVLQGSTTPFSSIYMPVYGHHVHNRGASDNYLSPARRVGGGTFGSSNWNPMDTFMQLFTDGQVPTGGGGPAPEYSKNKGRADFLSAAAAQLETVKCIGGDEARKKMEILLTSYEDLERETRSLIDSQGGSNSVDVGFDIPQGWTNTSGSRNDRSKYWNQPQNFGKMVDIAIDTTIAALALDRTRCSLMQFSASGTQVGPASGDHYLNLNIPGLEGRRSRHDHGMGHASGDNKADIRRDHARIQRWYSGRLAYLVRRLKEIPDGSGSLFDSTLIIATSEFGTYDHRRENIPHMSIGNLGGTMTTGRHYNAGGNNNLRNQADLFLGYAHALGINLNRFGGSRNAYKPFL